MYAHIRTDAMPVDVFYLHCLFGFLHHPKHRIAASHNRKSIELPCSSMALPREKVTQKQLKDLGQRPDFKCDDAITAAGICFREIKRDLDEIPLSSRRARIMRREFNDAALFAFKLIIFGLKFPPQGRDLLLEVSISAMAEYYEHLSAHDMHWHRNMGTIFRHMTWLFPDQNEEADIRDLDDSTTSPADTTTHKDTLPTLLIQVPELAKKVERVLGTSVYNEDAHSLYTVLRTKCEEGSLQGGSASSKTPKPSSNIAESQEHSWSHYGTAPLDVRPRETLEMPRSNDASISRFLASLMAASTENEKRLNGSTENLVVESSLATEFEDMLRILEEDGVEGRTACGTSGRNPGITNLRELLGESKAKRRHSPIPDSQRKLLKAITPPPDSQHGAFLNRIITPEPTAVSGFPAEDLASPSILPSYFSGVQTADDDPWYFDNQDSTLGQ